MFYLMNHRKYHWVDSLAPQADTVFGAKFGRFLAMHHTCPVFLCIGTPLLYGDALGPHIGTALKNHGIDHVYGTLDTPVHAENIEYYRKVINQSYAMPTIIAIDAALGTKMQEGYITLRHGALHPGKAIGKSIAPIGNIEITGIFENIGQRNAESVMLHMGEVIIQGIIKNLKKK